MRQIDRLFNRVMKLKKNYSDVIIISNQTGRWMIEGREFPNLEAAEQAVDDTASGEDDIYVIINDVGPGGIEKDEVGHDRYKIEDRDADRDKKDAHEGDKHDCKQKDGRKDGEYHHTWV